YPDVDPAKVHTVHNGIDTQVWTPQTGTAALEKYGIDPDKPFVAFVGRITRQKGVPHLLRAALRLPEDVQLVLCVGAPDTAELAHEVNGLIAELRRTRQGVVVIEGMIPRHEVMEILTAATVFACPSVYEPL
ncbi:glycosyltransferase, partial [Xanthomonas citri pv. citri]|nr:glycosyltransferase [Xanthomonas citri pv. citri]